MEEMGDEFANVTRESLLKLHEEKEKIETEIIQLNAVLSSNNVGMTEALVDSQGYPRSDVDVYRVRHARHKIICLQNDHKALMTKIEQGLHHLHAQQREGIGMPMETAQPQVKEVEMIPIARVNLVTPNSPSSDAGVMEEDVIIQFGSVNADNFRSLQDIGNVVKASVGMPVEVLILRKWLGSQKKMKLNLTPRKWDGQGLLGCNIVPMAPSDSVER
ncbi:26S proteasome non-ATPase regulatory subunit 9 [Hetaerina americana]|uniref:26S proteasome non-ATPase regulatory subunit 9 n=1 Tax=Hetaerina americana TaxID=62018 RepID=UPI003A7F57A6